MRTQLAPLWKWDVLRQADCASCNPPVPNPVVFKWASAVRRRGQVVRLCHLSGVETNESVFFSFLCARWDNPSWRSRNRLSCHLVIEKLNWDDKKASATSITCTVLSAIITSLKATVEWFPKRHCMVLSTWLTRTTFSPEFRAVFHGLRLPWFYGFLPTRPNFPHISCICLYPLCLPMLSWIFHVSHWLLSATWHHIKGGTTTQCFIYLY